MTRPDQTTTDVITLGDRDADYSHLINYLKQHSPGRHSVVHIGKYKPDWIGYISNLKESSYSSHLLGAFDAGYHAGNANALKGIEALITTVVEQSHSGAGDMHRWIEEDIANNGIWAAIGRYAAVQISLDSPFQEQRDYRVEVAATRASSPEAE
jgi:hypothetical protein